MEERVFVLALEASGEVTTARSEAEAAEPEPEEAEQ